MTAVVIRIDHIVQDVIHFRFVLQIEGIVALQSIGANGATNTRLGTEIGIAHEVNQHFQPGVMARTIVVVIRSDRFQLETKQRSTEKRRDEQRTLGRE